MIELTMNDMAHEQHNRTGRMSVVLFFGPGCGPCSFTMPFYELTEQYFTSLNAPIDFFKINAWLSDEQKQYCDSRWQVTGVPHIKLFYKNIVINTREGGGDEDLLKKLVHDGIDEVFKKFGDRL